MNLRSRLLVVSFVSAAMVLQGCSSVKKSLGIDRDAPDEFCVNPSSQPLDMPPDFFTLPNPEPGKPRPQEVKDMEAKKEKFVGTNTKQQSLSPGQKTILEMAGAEPGKDNIRPEIDNASRIEKAKGKPVLEQLGIKKTDSYEVINPLDEAADLQKKGIPQTQAPKS